MLKAFLRKDAKKRPNAFELWKHEWVYDSGLDNWGEPHGQREAEEAAAAAGKTASGKNKVKRGSYLNGCGGEEDAF
jgi:hypothetical protein